MSMIFSPRRACSECKYTTARLNASVGTIVQRNHSLSFKKRVPVVFAAGTLSEFIYRSKCQDPIAVELPKHSCHIHLEEAYSRHHDRKFPGQL